MDDQHWFDRWREGRIGFHKDQVNPHLQRYASLLGEPDPARVLVPLCGKTVDLAWLAGEGWAVEGVELVPEATAAFFDERDWKPTEVSGALPGRQAEGVTLWTGDYFAFSSKVPFTALYDRAALIALPEALRQRYVQHTLGLLQPEARALVVTLEYDQSAMAGPPFSVPPAEVEALYSERYTIEKLTQEEVLDDSPFAARGLTWLKETAWLLTPRA